MQNVLPSTSSAAKRINHADSHGLLCNSTPAQHPHQYQNLGTNSHPQCCARFPFTVLGNSRHYSSIHRKLGVSENIFMVLTSNFGNRSALLPLVFICMCKDRNLLQTSPEALSRKLFQDILFMWTANTTWSKRSFVSHSVTCLFK